MNEFLSFLARTKDLREDFLNYIPVMVLVSFFVYLYSQTCAPTTNIVTGPTSFIINSSQQFQTPFCTYVKTYPLEPPMGYGGAANSNPTLSAVSNSAVVGTTTL